MAHDSRGFTRTALLSGGALLAVLVTGCGSGSGPTPAASNTATGGGHPSRSTSTWLSPPSAQATPARTTDGASVAGTARCHTTNVRASLGADNPGAGQENFPVTLTNISQAACTVSGYPGAAFTDASGHQLAPSPARTFAIASTVTLMPGQSAWSGLSFANPAVSGARSSIPTWLLITPPDEENSLRVRWTSGPVPVSGDDSAVSLTVLTPGAGT
jgi:hypothetical protein